MGNELQSDICTRLMERINYGVLQNSLIEVKSPELFLIRFIKIDLSHHIKKRRFLKFKCKRLRKLRKSSNEQGR